MISRIIQAARILAGIRPAEVRFNRADASEAELDSILASDAIVWQLYPTGLNQPCAEYVEKVIRREVLEAILRYAGQLKDPPPKKCDDGPFEEIPF